MTSGTTSTAERPVNEASAPKEASAAAVTESERVAARLRSLQLSAEERSYAAGGGTWWLVRWIAMLCLIFGGVYWIFGDGQRQAELLVASLTENKVAIVEAFRVKKEAPRHVILDVTGYLGPRRELSLMPIVQGVLIDLPVSVGDRVKQGDLLARIDSGTYLAEVKQAEAALATAESRLLELRNGTTPEEIRQAETDVEQAESNLELAVSQLRRSEESQAGISRRQHEAAVFKEQSSRLQLDSARLMLTKVKQATRAERIEAAEADVAQAEATLAHANWYLKQTRLLSPTNGVVVRRNADLGEIYAPDPLGGGMIVVADMTEMYAYIDVQERELHLIELGQPCEVIPDAYPGRRYEGVVDRLGAEVDRARGVLDVRIRLLDTDDKLLPDMNCRAVVYSTDAEDAALVIRAPVDTVVEENGRFFVWIEEDGTAVRREVRPAVEKLPKRGRVELLSGLAEGDILLVPTGEPLKEGVAVSPTFDVPR